jgi:hypothetical protein
VLADPAGGAWTFGASILSFSFPMLLFIVVAAWLYVTYTKPELVPGHRNPAVEHPVIFTHVPGQPPATDSANEAKTEGGE